MVDAEFPAAKVPPVTFKPPLAVRLAPLPTVKVPLLEVTAPVTEPCPFQLPPVTPRVLARLPPGAKLTMPLPVRVALLLMVPVPLRVPAVATATVPPEAIEPLTVSVPPVMLVAPI